MLANQLKALKKMIERERGAAALGSVAELQVTSTLRHFGGIIIHRHIINYFVDPFLPLAT